MIDTDKYERRLREAQPFNHLAWELIQEVKRLREEIERIAGITNGYVGPTKAWAEHITKDLLAVIE
jgi:hypothetical protein